MINEELAYIPIQVWQNIFDFCDFNSQLTLSSLCSLFYNNLFITDLYYIDKNTRLLLNDKIIKQQKYKYTTKINAYGNEKIKDVSHMASTLKILYADGDCGIDQNCIANLHLVELNAYGNKKIKDVSHMASTLKVLNAGGKCGIDQSCISNLHLFKLYASFNEKIKDVSHMASTLKILYADGDCGIDQNCIANLHLVELYASFNE